MILVQKLYQALQNLQAALDEISETIRLERTAIVELKTTEMENHAKRLSELFPTIEPLNQNLSLAIKETAEEMLLPNENRISELAKHLPKPDREKLLPLQKSVLVCAESINNDLAINQALLLDSHQFTTNSLQIFTNALKQTSNATYGQQGRFVEAVEQPHIICKEI